MKRRAANVFAKIMARAKRGPQHVEVEHLLLLAKVGDESVAGPLRALAAEQAWPMAKRGYVPLGMWAESVATFLESGPAALARGVKKKTLDGDVVLGLLEEVFTVDSLVACLAIAADPKLTRTALEAVMFVAAKKSVAVDAATEKRARSLAEKWLKSAKRDVDRAAAYGVLARFGDARSLALVERTPAERASSAFDFARGEALKKLKRRLA